MKVRRLLKEKCFKSEKSNLENMEGSTTLAKEF